MKLDGSEASPMKAVVGELENLRQSLRETLSHYQARLEGDIDAIRDVVSQDLGSKIDSGKLRDLRDMLTVLRHAQVKAEKGRRKDVKRIEGVVADLKILIEHWK